MAIGAAALAALKVGKTAMSLFGKKGGGAASKGERGGVLSKLLGSGMGSPLAMGMGAIQMGVGAVKRKQAEAAQPSKEDLGDRSLLNAISAKERMMQTGTGDPSSVLARQMAASAGRNAFKMGGPVNFGQVNQAIANAATQTAMVRNEQLNNLMNLKDKVVDRMASRKFDLNMYNTQTKQAQAEQAASAGQDNLLSGAGDGTELKNILDQRKKLRAEKKANKNQ